MSETRAEEWTKRLNNIMPWGSSTCQHNAMVYRYMIFLTLIIAIKTKILTKHWFV